MRTYRGLPWMGLTCVLAFWPLTAHAQDYPRVEAAFVVAPSEYDLSGVGWTSVYALRLPIGTTSWFTVEPGMTYFSYEGQSSQDIWYINPEVQAQLTPFQGRVRPYLGAGVGVARGSSEGRSEWDATLSGALGLRAGLAGPWSALGEVRVRTIDPWTGTLGEFGLGLARRF